MDPKGMFKIGQRNYTVLKKILWKNNILIEGESIGASVSRTMLLDMKTGVTKVKSMGKIFEI
jgi:chemotaxis protein CheD